MRKLKDKKRISVKLLVASLILSFMVFIGGTAVYLAITLENGIEIFTKAHLFWGVYLPSLAATVNSFMKQRNQAKVNYRNHQLAAMKANEKTNNSYVKGEKK